MKRMLSSVFQVLKNYARIGQKIYEQYYVEVKQQKKTVRTYLKCDLLLYADMTTRRWFLFATLHSRYSILKICEGEVNILKHPIYKGENLSVKSFMVALRSHGLRLKFFV